MTSRRHTPSRPPTTGSRRRDELLADGGLPELSQTRQVLVCGTGVAGLAVAAALQQSGHDTVLVDATGERPESAVTTVWQPGLRLLDRLGVGDAVRDAGRRLDTVAVRVEDDRRTLTADGDAAPPLVVGTGTLRELLGDRVRSATTLSTGLESVSQRGDALEVAFANGVREYFDLVVGADGHASAVRPVTDRDRPEWTRLARLEVPLGDEAGAVRPLDAWRDRAVAQALPFPGGDTGGVLRLTVPSSARDQVDAAAVAGAAVPDADATGEPAAAVSTAEWTPARQADREDGSWGVGRVAYCGTAAFPVPRVTGLQAALALEDAWVLADELARGPDDVAAAVAAYARRRRRRVRNAFRRIASVRGRSSYPEAGAEPLTATSGLRAAALGALCTAPLAELQRGVPCRL